MQHLHIHFLASKLQVPNNRKGGRGYIYLNPVLVPVYYRQIISTILSQYSLLPFIMCVFKLSYETAPNVFSCSSFSSLSILNYFRNGVIKHVVVFVLGLQWKCANLRKDFSTRPRVNARTQ